MITLKDLQALYDSTYIEDKKFGVKINEPQRNNPDALSEVIFCFSGTLIHIKSSFLNDSKSIFSKGSNYLSFKHICDGVFIVKNDKSKYLVWIELKSSYNEVCKKAIFQLPASYTKLKSHLKNLPSYIPNEYKEIGIIISYSPKLLKDDENNEEVMSYKRKLIDSSTKEDIIKYKYDKDIRKFQATFLDGIDFGFDKININEDIKMKSLYIYHYIADSPKIFINLDSILDTA